jgi:DNA-binding response OmpR family regulator
MKKVIIVDDDKEFLEEMTETLLSSGYDTISFSDGKRVLEDAPKIKPDVILLDLKMDGMNGFKIANELRRSSEIRKTPIIAITGFYTEKKHRLLIKICGIKKCLIKPINPLDVITAIEYAKS